jgi:hypothetical protein
MDDPNAVKNGDNAGKETVAKADFDAKVAEVDKMSKELEDMRLEVFSQDYLDFLDNKDKGKGKETSVKEGNKELTDDDLKGLTPKQIIEKAKELAKQELAADIEKAKTDVASTMGKEQRQRDVAAFARGHEDYEIYRPIMYGISLDPKNKDLTLQELYEKSKAHVANIHGTPSKEEQERQRKLASEKPGGSSESLASEEKYKNMTPEAIAKETAAEVEAKLGPIPSM